MRKFYKLNFVQIPVKEWIIVVDKQGEIYYYNNPSKVVIHNGGIAIFYSDGKIDSFDFEDLMGTKDFGCFVSNNAILFDLVKQKFEEWKERRKQK